MVKFLKWGLGITACLSLLCACRKTQQSTLFKLLPSSVTGITFSNTLTESDSLNILNHPYLYNGAGVGIGDFNRDGLPDIYFAGNMTGNKLYLNKGGLKFSDITTASRTEGKGRWCTGVSVVDINNDGWPDIYVCASFNKNTEMRRNLLYINQGLNKDGIPVFKESAKEYGLDDSGYSTQAIFFDYNRDGLPDVYILTNVLDKGTPVSYRPKVADGSAVNNDRLYRNNGNGTFTNVTRQAGIQLEGFGNSVCITDVNNDGWPDIYVGNDFISNDLLYVNNKDGTFTNRAGEYFKHTGWSVMGADMVDINNDGLPDLISLEMLPEQNLRKKTMLMGDNYITYINNKKYNYEHQYIRNVVQLNQGKNPGGNTRFSEIAYLAGVYQTDWSWTPLVADFDNDGFRDLVITNGYPRDVTDLDHALLSNGQGQTVENTSLASADSFPVVKTSGYAFRNTGGYVFEDKSKDWGISHPAFSNGAAYADLDNDGDLDLVVNNIDDKAFIYENTRNTREHIAAGGNYLSVILTGSRQNLGGIGATIRIYYGDRQQLYDQQPCRGYMSTDDARAHFGLGSAKLLDSLRIRWPDGKTQLLRSVKVNQTIKLIYASARGSWKPGIPVTEKQVFESVAGSVGINFKHQERDAIDYNIQPTLPHKLSQYGPCLATGDIDRNGTEDFYIGGAAGRPGTFYIQDRNGKFHADSTRFINEPLKKEEDMGALLFDANNDGFPDLYVVSGSYEFPSGSPMSQDRLYLNDGHGYFSRSYAALPPESDNGSCVRAADFDRDGDLDLFVGGRSVSGEYPSAPSSHLYKNEGGMFTDVTDELCPGLRNIGMVTDAIWSDIDNDGLIDLVLVGEWMPVTFFKNTGHGFKNITPLTGIGSHVGWWNSIVAADFNNDGNMDYVAGNLGLNSNYKATFKQPMTILAKDLDHNGSFDSMIFCYMKAEDGSMQPYPMHTRDDLISQMISIRKKFPTYKGFGKATLNDFWSKQDLEQAIRLQATDMNSSIIENKGDGTFTIRPLPLEAQLAPVYGMLALDIDNDGLTDLLLTGNDFGMEPFTGRHDAFNGLYLKGNGKGDFKAVSLASSGFFVGGDAKALALIHSVKGADLYLASQNQDSLKVFRLKTFDNKKSRWIDIGPLDSYADILYSGNRIIHQEFYYGSGYLSQSSRKLKLGPGVLEVYLTDFRGKKRLAKF